MAKGVIFVIFLAVASNDSNQHCSAFSTAPYINIERDAIGHLKLKRLGSESRSGILFLRAEWLRATGQVRVKAPMHTVWSMWSNIENLPEWQVIENQKE